jgi:hypothetical protein
MVCGGRIVCSIGFTFSLLQKTHLPHSCQQTSLAVSSPALNAKPKMKSAT